MKRFGLRLGIAILTFFAGISLTTIWGLFSPQHSEAKFVQPPAIQCESSSAAEPSQPAQTRESIPEKFKHVDFKNLSYRYNFPYGKKKDFTFTLKNGEYEYEIDDDRGWFSLKDVYYADLSGDGTPEAIVLVWHVSCGVSCDGGAGLFYVYSIQANRLKAIWRYETGSLAYGCGLKSLAVKNRKVTMELFGRCSDPTKGYSGSGKFYVEDTTRFVFRYTRGGFLEEKKKFISVPERSVKNYEPEIRVD